MNFKCGFIWGLGLRSPFGDQNICDVTNDHSESIKLQPFLQA